MATPVAVVSNYYCWQHCRFALIQCCGTMRLSYRPELLKHTMKSKQKSIAARFGIAEWYGQSFMHLSPKERGEFATYKPDKGKRLSSSERERLASLSFAKVQRELSLKEQDRLKALTELQRLELKGNKSCPFKSSDISTSLCTKEGGVCSLQLYEQNTKGNVRPAEGERGAIRVLCPYRFHEKNLAFKWIGEFAIESTIVEKVGEVGFLESDKSLDSGGGEDVGRLDMILVDADSINAQELRWVAAEIQAVYFSGREMATEFTAIAKHVREGGDGLIWPTEVRRPDYRSSGPKRLMPQLQIKVPTLRRWGKKMAVLVDEAFFQSLGRMQAVDDISNADIAWFRVTFVLNPTTKRYQIKRGDAVLTTLEESVKGLTAGTPVSKGEFEARIKQKLLSP